MLKFLVKLVFFKKIEILNINNHIYYHIIIIILILKKNINQVLLWNTI